jgi:ankyrin repeat protein
MVLIGTNVVGTFFSSQFNFFATTDFLMFFGDAQSPETSPVSPRATKPLSSSASPMPNAMLLDQSSTAMFETTERNIFGETTFHFAMRYGHYDFIKNLITRSACRHISTIDGTSTDRSISAYSPLLCFFREHRNASSLLQLVKNQQRVSMNCCRLLFFILFLSFSFSL